MFRENISDYVKDEKAILYVPKNKGLCDYVRRLLPKIGINNGIAKNDGCKETLFEIKEKKASDIPRRILDNSDVKIKAYGLMGDDLFDEFILKTKENNLAVLNTYDWYDETSMYRRPALVLLNKSGSWEEFGKTSKIAIRREYANTIKEYLDVRGKQTGIDFAAEEYDGDLEELLFESKNKGCVEIVYSGNTIQKLGLKPVEVVRFSDIVLIGIKEQEQSLFEKEYQRILQRKLNPTDSYTSKLLKDRNEVVKKFGQEAAEYIQAFSNKNNLTEEALDVIYSTMLCLAYENMSWKDVESAIKRRW